MKTMNTKHIGLVALLGGLMMGSGFGDELTLKEKTELVVRHLKNRQAYLTQPLAYTSSNGKKHSAELRYIEAHHASAEKNGLYISFGKDICLVDYEENGLGQVDTVQVTNPQREKLTGEESALAQKAYAKFIESTFRAIKAENAEAEKSLAQKLRDIAGE